MGPVFIRCHLLFVIFGGGFRSAPKLGRFKTPNRFYQRPNLGFDLPSRLQIHPVHHLLEDRPSGLLFLAVANPQPVHNRDTPVDLFYNLSHFEVLWVFGLLEIIGPRPTGGLFLISILLWPRLFQPGIPALIIRLSPRDPRFQTFRALVGLF